METPYHFEEQVENLGGPRTVFAMLEQHGALKTAEILGRNIDTLYDWRNRNRYYQEWTDAVEAAGKRGRPSESSGPPPAPGGSQCRCHIPRPTTEEMVQRLEAIYARRRNAVTQQMRGD